MLIIVLEFKFSLLLFRRCLIWSVVFEFIAACILDCCSCLVSEALDAFFSFYEAARPFFDCLFQPVEALSSPPFSCSCALLCYVADTGPSICSLPALDVKTAKLPFPLS